MKIIVTDGTNRAALAITRSLGREGHDVIVGAEQERCLSSMSRYCRESFLYPDPRKDQQEFARVLLEVVKEIKPDILMPVTDVTTLLVTENKTHFEKYCSVPFADYEAVEQAANKFNLVSLAKKIGVPVPKTFCLEGPDDFESALSACKRIGYPIVVKSSRSRIRRKNGWVGTGVKYAREEIDLKGIILDAQRKEEFPLLLQERIVGEGVGIFLCLDRGRAVAAFNHRRIREKPPSGGVSVLRESVPLDPVLKEYSEQLLNALKWHGVAMVEFKRDKRTGEGKLMEINGRFWGSLQLAIDSGVNFPSILVKIAKGEKIAPITDYRIGVKTRWFWGDVDALLTRIIKSNKTLNLPPGFPSRLRMILSFLKLWGKDLHYEVEDKDDIKPWLYETKCWFRGTK